ncbi:MAG: SPOR domain-containing protein [Desulfamplus sp.]|nr:SPOR domain-containing protein [Desulfamplus sp.]
MLFLKGLLKYSGLFMLSGWMFFIGLLVGRGTSPVEFDTGWFQERLAVIFEDYETEETVLEKPELDFYAALQKSELKEDYDLKVNKSSADKKSEAGKLTPLSGDISEDLAFNDLKEPLQKNKKPMTSKLYRKQTASLSGEMNDNAQQRIKPISSLVKTDKIKSSGQLASQSELEQTKRAISSAKIKIASQPVEIKSSSETKEPLSKPLYKKSEQSVESKDYAGGGGYSYTIQIASFNTEADAMSHIAKLGAQGYSAYKSSGMVGDKTWYRIRIGNFNNITEAKESLKKLESSGIKGLIIQKE